MYQTTQADGQEDTQAGHIHKIIMKHVVDSQGLSCFYTSPVLQLKLMACTFRLLLAVGLLSNYAFSSSPVRFIKSSTDVLLKGCQESSVAFSH